MLFLATPGLTDCVILGDVKPKSCVFVTGAYDVLDRSTPADCGTSLGSMRSLS